MWESLGFAAAYFMGTKICILQKLSFVAFFLVVGMLGYYAVELLEAKRRRPAEVDKS